HFPSKVEILEALVEPAFDVMSDLLERWDEGGGDLDEFGSSLTGLIDWMLDHQDLFILIDRNIESIEALSQRSEGFKAHAELHERMDQMLADGRRPAVDRIRMIAAIGAAT